MTTPVTQIPAASSELALSHFSNLLKFETDCWDTHESLQSENPDFILVDVRSPAMFKQGHVPGAINIPHGKMTEGYMKRYANDTLFVVYCAGPHCNGADKAATRLATLALPVKIMIGGITGWVDEGFTLTDESNN